MKHYDETTWRMVLKQVMFTGCALKFKQNEQLKLKLKQTKGVLVEANPKDKYFSCGLTINDPTIEDRNASKGENILGDILCKKRDIV